MKFVSADLIRQLMLGSVALQGNCEWTLWQQKVDEYVDKLTGYDIEKVYQQGWNDALDAVQNAKFASVAEQTEPSDSEKPNNCKTEPQTVRSNLEPFRVTEREDE